MKVHSFHEVARNAEAKTHEGWDVYQQFNCAGCGAKQTMPDKNVFYRSGRCEKCGHVTNIVKDGCNFMAISSMK